MLLIFKQARKAQTGKKSSNRQEKLKQARQADNYLKRLNDKTQTKKLVIHQESLYHKHFWKVAGKCANGTLLDRQNLGATFPQETADVYFPGKYISANPVVLYNLSWFPYLPVNDNTTGSVHTFIT